MTALYYAHLKNSEEMLMMNDPIVEEIRRVRHAHAAMHNNDLTEICKALRVQEQLSPRPVVNRAQKSATQTAYISTTNQALNRV